VEHARTLDELRELTRRCRLHVLVLLDPADAWPALRKALDDCEGLPPATLLIADRSRAETAIEALRGGVSDVLLRPFSTEDLVAAVKAVCRQSAPGSRGAVGGPGRVLVGDTVAMQEIRVLIERLAPMAATVLVEGEPGSGRTLVAELLHEHSGRRGPFVAIDCRIPDHRRLADQLARHTRDGATGTLFLDEIHALPLDLQAEMLRSMEHHAVAGQGGQMRAGRIVASTQVNLAERVARHRFREDLRHRLAVMRIGLPPLRARRSDIALLAAHFVDRLSAEKGLSRIELEPAEIEALEEHDWPGNVAQLCDTVEQTLLRGRLPADALAGTVQRGPWAPDYPLDWTLEQVKRHHMACVLEACDGNKSAAARRLDISRKTLDRKLGSAGHE
jgi:DNA-binding NtrC family response regulator